MPRAKQTQYTGLCLAYNPPLPQEGIPFEVWKRPEALAVPAFQARKRFNLSMRNDTVTFNHIWQLVKDNGERDTIPKSESDQQR